MDITFANQRLQKECESRRALQRTHGQAGARKLMARLADLSAASTLEDARSLPGRCHELDGDRKGQLAVELSGGKRLVFEGAADPPPRKKDGGLDWLAIDAIRVLEIVDYH